MLVSFFNVWFCDLPACKLEDWNVTISHRPHSLFMQTVWSGLHYQFLCHVLKGLFFIKIALKLSYFWKKMQNFQALGALPQTPTHSPPKRISAYAPGNFILFIIISIFVAFALSNFFRSFRCKPYDVKYRCTPSASLFFVWKVLFALRSVWLWFHFVKLH